MFNYQSQLKVLEAIKKVNVTSDDVYERWRDLQHHLPPFVLKGSEYLGNIYAQWSENYSTTYQWIHPRLIEISNTSLHYGTGVSVGVLASLLILILVLMKLLPARLKTIGYFLMAIGMSVSLWTISSFSMFFTDPVTDTVLQYWQYILGYCVVMGLISFALVYRYGPVTEERTLNLLQWFLQGIGLTLIYNSTQIREVSVALILVTLAVYNFPREILFNNQTSKNIWFRFFPPKVRLLTEDEYIRQGNIETKNELEKLREYCRSPDCHAWKIISKLKSPHRFAEFVEGNSWHVNNDELLEYDTGPDPTPPHLVTDDEDDESEMDFVLSSQ